MSSRVQTLVQLTDELVVRLDRAASRRTVSRSELIRDLLEHGLAVEERDEISLQLIDGYGRAPQEEARDAWGDLDAWSEIAARRNLAALNEEERERW